MLIGTNKHEGLLYMIPHLLDDSVYDQIRENWDTVGAAGLLGIVDLTELTEEDVAKSHQLLDYYIGGVENYNAENLYGLLDMHTDSGFLHGTYKTVQILLDHGVSVHQYLLTHVGQYSYTQLYGIPEPVSKRFLKELKNLHRSVCPMLMTSSTSGTLSLMFPILNWQERCYLLSTP